MGVEAIACGQRSKSDFCGFDRVNRDAKYAPRELRFSCDQSFTRNEFGGRLVNVPFSQMDEKQRTRKKYCAIASRVHEEFAFLNAR